ncbi:succinate dehydrogenase, cytochrome b556 subunit [Thiospirillum jenense]|uniref:Succinate dehydrogenase cytochrome b556 subunit n=2 Tax=Thiospirillum jenense TaxID=1653858 RepID=A0A839HBS5_9GAMM|nr:succinate dehydrogenase, cytochrome b556 subunit [Thiospirillum jenense]
MPPRTQRPVFLDLRHIHLPLPGVVSILHRLSGLILLLVIPIGIGLFAYALVGEAEFMAAAALFSHPATKLVRLVLIWACVHHLIAGVRYLALDFGWGITRPMARYTAAATLIVSVIFTLLLGSLLL